MTDLVIDVVELALGPSELEAERLSSPVMESLLLRLSVNEALLEALVDMLELADSLAVALNELLRDTLRDNV